MGRVKISKEQLSKLDTVAFTGTIHVIDSAELVKDAIAHLSWQERVGFDTETRPSFKRGVVYSIALMQISTLTDCFLFRLNTIGVPAELKEFLENEAITKIGLSLRDDFGRLHAVSDTVPRGFVELQAIAPQYGIADASLQKIYAIIFNQRISKNQRLTNWEADQLTPGQQSYAAIDAWACLKIYNHLESVGFDPLASQYYTEDDETPTI